MKKPGESMASSVMVTNECFRFLKDNNSLPFIISIISNYHCLWWKYLCKFIFRVLGREKKKIENDCSLLIPKP